MSADHPLAGHRVVITGASSGIGAATAVAFAAAGARVVLGARGREGLDDVASRCAAAGGNAIVRPVDCTDAAAVATFAAEARDLLGGIDLWFSCEGVGVLGRYEDVPIADHARVVDVNLVAHMNDVHAVLPIFLAQDRGTWVNMISAGGFVATPYAAAYSASKFGLRGFSAALRGEVSKRPHIHICDVCPTFVDTPGVDHAGNYTGARLALPPGSLAPETVAKAVVGLATRPRNFTAIGAPAIAFKLGEFAAPNLLAAILNGFLDTWSARAPDAADSDGVLFEPGVAVGPDGGRHDPDRRRKVAAATSGIAVLGVAGIGIWLGRRR
ncbi:MULTISPECIES: SDR family oxidoreductase [unclassified Sphingomonas]|uniref:SDR family oxidoreductase n=1 Tax=unclassified Sphingomonas TaxID=196159 RepID=UPI0006FF9EDE|nr:MULTISPECIES: SDR family oxidoreductase [unclassified Sphingomonas]KQN20346.1 short-chain dehydrogenase [Sphingomonas sp. Leaf30]MBD8551636.1 SDR family oxidoreductase [Sphingomonas sp. CFBP 8764]